MPKRPVTSYLYFCSSVREHPTPEYLTMSMTDRSKYAGRKWKSMSAEERAPYVEMAHQDKLRYGREMIEWEKPPGGLVLASLFADIVSFQQ